MNIVNVGYRSTNYYVLEIKGGRLLFDCGWPGTFPQFAAKLKRKSLSPAEIAYVLASHFHMDHAGVVQEFKNLGAKLILLKSQIGFPQKLNDFMQHRREPFLPINECGNLILNFTESRTFLASLGLEGEIISTPGHSDDSITLILDNGYAFTGDLTPRMLVTEENHAAKESWERIYQHKITRIFPAHGG
jgi:ribonuclease/clavin/mitogillin